MKSKEVHPIKGVEIKYKLLALGGGGNKGAYQAGVVHELIGKLGSDYDYITGVSVGALNSLAFIFQHKNV